MKRWVPAAVMLFSSQVVAQSPPEPVPQLVVQSGHAVSPVALAVSPEGTPRWRCLRATTLLD